MYNYLSKTRKQRGSSLIEILVAMFILAAGLLGLASVQMLSIKNINNSQFHSLATTYAYDMAERMRSNRAAVSAGNYDAITSTTSDPRCNPCTIAQTAQLDGFQWNQQIKLTVDQGGLPGGGGTVTRNGNLYDIVVTWNEQQRNNTGGNVSTIFLTLSINI